MAQTASGEYRKQKWYNRNVFPLIPIVSIRKADQHNTSGFTFRWLFFTAWTLDAVEFEIAVTIDSHWGIGLKGILPYLRWCISIPCPEKIAIWIQRNLWRKPHQGIKH